MARNGHNGPGRLFTLIPLPQGGHGMGTAGTGMAQVRHNLGTKVFHPGHHKIISHGESCAKMGERERN